MQTKKISPVVMTQLKNYVTWMNENLHGHNLLQTRNSKATKMIQTFQESHCKTLISKSLRPSKICFFLFCIFLIFPFPCPGPYPNFSLWWGQGNASVPWTPKRMRRSFFVQRYFIHLKNFAENVHFTLCDCKSLNIVQ